MSLSRMSPTPVEEWQRALAASQRSGVRVVELNDSREVDILQKWASPENHMDRRIVALGQEWVTYKRFTWRDIVAGSIHNATDSSKQDGQRVDEQLNKLSVYLQEAFTALCGRVINVAVVLSAGQMRSYDRWSCLVQIAPPAFCSSTVLRFYPPALLDDLTAASQELPFDLPRSYKELCLWTNGIDLDARQLFGINGIGPARADWEVVSRQDWRACAQYREVAAQYKYFQGMYDDILAYEASEDVAKVMPHLYRRRLMPVYMTRGGDYWCVNVSQDTSTEMAGEPPVVYWDHESRNIASGFSRESVGQWFLALATTSQ